MIRQMVVALVAVISLLCCLASPFFYFSGKVIEKDFKWLFLGASVFYFIFAVLWASAKKKDRRRG